MLCCCFWAESFLLTKLPRGAYKIDQPSPNDILITSSWLMMSPLSSTAKRQILLSSFSWKSPHVQLWRKWASDLVSRAVSQLLASSEFWRINLIPLEVFTIICHPELVEGSVSVRFFDFAALCSEWHYLYYNSIENPLPEWIYDIVEELWPRFWRLKHLVMIQL